MSEIGSDTPAIEAAGLTKRFGQTMAADGISFVVPRGMVFGLLGPNGAGKTTTVRILSTLLRPDAGTARVAGHDVVAQADAVRRRIGLVGQYASVDELLSGRQNLVMIARLHGLPPAAARQRADELIERFDLAEPGRKSVKTYSGGMRRRLDLAASLVVSPPVLFLDEPTTGLDPSGRAATWDVISTMTRDGTTVLLTTQYLDEADRFADRVAVIDHGRLVAEGTPASLKAKVAHATLAVHLGGTFGEHRTREIVARHALSAPFVRGGDLMVPLRDLPAAAELVATLASAGASLDQVSIVKPSLDDVFFALTGGDRAAPGKDCRMTAATIDTDAPPAAVSKVRPGLAKTLDEIWVFVRRNLAHIPRVPERLADVTVQPIMFVLLFGYVFGSAIALPGGGNYQAFLMAGVFVQTLAFQSVTTAVGVVGDMQAAVIDRFRVLPIARGSMLIGRTIASLFEGFIGIVVMAICGLLVGWMPQNGILETTAALGLLVFFAFAMISLGTAVGLLVRSAGTAQTLGFVIIFPLSFASNAFVPTDNMPAWLRVLTDWSPVSAIVAAVRELFGNPNPIPADAAWPLAHAIPTSLLWCAALTTLGLGLAIWRYSRAGGR